MNTQNKEPNIRFDQFKELWKVVKLDSISQKVKTKNINDAFQNVLTNSAEFGIIPQRDFFDKDIANLKSLNGYYVVQPNDFVYNPRISNKAPVGPIKANFLNSTGVMSPLYYVFRTRNIDVFFLAKYFDSSYWHKFMKLNGDTGARSDRFAIKDSVFKEMPIPFPSHSEQTAIGSLFRTLDDLLASYKDNLANYQSLKATMLSKMFPKTGQTVPEIRLDGFEGEWERRSLSEVCTINSGRDYKHLKDGDIPVYGTGGYMLSVNEKLSDEDAIGIGRKGTIDKPYLLSAPFWTVDTLFYVTCKVGYDLNYLFLIFQKVRWKKFDESTGVPSLSKKTIEKVVSKFPSLPEQQAIGSYFSNLDNLINSHQEKISQLETLKKKLLQNMFI